MDKEEKKTSPSKPTNSSFAFLKQLSPDKTNKNPPACSSSSSCGSFFYILLLLLLLRCSLQTTANLWLRAPSHITTRTTHGRPHLPDYYFILPSFPPSLPPPRQQQRTAKMGDASERLLLSDDRRSDLLLSSTLLSGVFLDESSHHSCCLLIWCSWLLSLLLILWPQHSFYK